MASQGVAGIVIEAGTSMLYFSGLAWRQASRFTALVIPSSGNPVIVAPAFEESKLREIMVMEMEVRTWEEHESPFALIAGVLDDRGVQGTIGLEKTVRFFVAEGLKQDARLARDRFRSADRCSPEADQITARDRFDSGGKRHYHGCFIKRCIRRSCRA